MSEQHVPTTTTTTAAPGPKASEVVHMSQEPRGALCISAEWKGPVEDPAGGPVDGLTEDPVEASVDGPAEDLAEEPFDDLAGGPVDGTSFGAARGPTPPVGVKKGDAARLKYSGRQPRHFLV
jgi:hypothetical protein